MGNTCVIMFSQQRSICLSIRDSNMDGVPTKILSRASLTNWCSKPVQNILRVSRLVETASGIYVIA